MDASAGTDAREINRGCMKGMVAKQRAFVRDGGRVLPAESRRHVNASAIRIPSSFSFLLTTFVLSVFREISWNAARRRGDSVEIVLVQSRPGKT